MPRLVPEIVTFLLTAVACGEPPVEHRERPGRGSESTSADAQVEAAEASAELASIIGYQCPNTPTSLAFGKQSVRVSAKSYWVSTGLYLQPGESARFTSSGSWTIWAGKTAPFSGDGGDNLTMVDGCRKGALVAKVGLSLDSKKICIGQDGDVTAKEAGIVYLGWELFTGFFGSLPTDWTNILPEAPTPLESWQWVYTQLSLVSGKDLSATFARYRVPLP